MARLKSTAPCFAVADISATIHWYEQQLGFESHHFPDDEPYVFGILVRDQIEIMLQQVDGYQKPKLYDQRNGGVWDVYIRMQGVKEFYELLRNKVEIVMPLTKQPYGDWEFEVKDLNGYVLVFSELLD
jgi:uncharacterized glyoxalase superfamily protein PhnB